MKPSNPTSTSAAGLAAAGGHLRLADLESPGTGAARFASFTPMNEQPGLADSKARFALGVSGLLLSTLLFFMPRLHELIRPTVQASLLLAGLLTAAVLILAAIRAAYAAFILTARPTPDSTVYFQNIAALPRESYEQAVCSADAAAAMRLSLDYNYTMARLGARKFQLVGRALLCLRVAIPIWMVLLLVLGMRT